nr:PREDICTED: cytochrome b-c1 complex subunit 7-like [Megachile rotundata]
MLRLSPFLKPGLSKRFSNVGRSKDWRFEIGKLAFNLSRYNRYGLYTHDILNFYEPIIEEVLRRLPKDVLDARNFRCIRAAQLDFMKTYLPKEKWITYEQDLEYRYMEPYIQEIIEERQEIYDFGCTNYREYDWPSGEVK